MGGVANFFERWVIYVANGVIMVGFISLILLLLIIGFSCFNFVQKRNTEEHSRVIIMHTGFKLLNTRTIRGSFWFLMASLFYCWNATSTQVSKFSLMRYPFCLWMITSHRVVVFIESGSKTLNEKAPVFYYTYLVACWWYRENVM